MHRNESCPTCECATSHTGFDRGVQGDLEIRAHGWMSHVVHREESCPTYDVSHIWIRHGTHKFWLRGAGQSRDQRTRMNESCHAYKWVVSNKCHLYEWVMSHIGFDRGARGDLEIRAHWWLDRSYARCAHAAQASVCEGVMLHAWVTYEWVMYEGVMSLMNESYMNESCDTWMSQIWTSQVTYEWVIYERVMWHVNESCIALSHTYEWMTTHIQMNTTHIRLKHTHKYTINESCITLSHTFIVWMRHVTCEWVMPPTNSSWLICMRYVTYEWVMSYMIESCTTLSHTFSLRRRSNLKYLDLQIMYFSYIINWVTGTPVYSRED